MNAPIPKQRFDGRPEVRQEIIELLGTASVIAELGMGHASIADDRALQYCLKRLRAVLCCALGHWNLIARENLRLAVAEHERQLADEEGDAAC